jgi:hypothetical protein
MGHRFRLADGTALDAVIDGPSAEAALRDSIVMHDQVAAAARHVGAIDLEHPNALALRPAAEALGLGSDSPTAWPGSFFTTLHGYLAAATTV